MILSGNFASNGATGGNGFYGGDGSASGGAVFVYRSALVHSACLKTLTGVNLCNVVTDRIFVLNGCALVNVYVLLVGVHVSVLVITLSVLVNE